MESVGGPLIRAYVFIQTRVGIGPQVARDVGRIKGVLSSEVVTGPYDVIARAEAPTLDDLGRLVPTHIHGVKGITRTISCIAARSSKPIHGTGLLEGSVPLFCLLLRAQRRSSVRRDGGGEAAVAFATREETKFGLRAQWIQPLGRPNRIYPFGRVCAVDGCRTVLSIYNGSEYCWVHEPVRYPRVRGKSMAKQAA